MSLPPQLRGLSEVKGAFSADAEGRILECEPATAADADAAATIAVAVSGLSAAGIAAGLGPLSTVVVKGTASSSATATRPDGLVHVTVDPATTTSQAEKVLREWSGAAPGAPSAPGPPGAPPPRPAAAPPPAARRPTPQPSKPVAVHPVMAGRPAAAVPARPAPARTVADPWAALRRSLGRGQLNEAVTYQHLLASPPDPERAGSEQLDADACDRTLRALLEGIGSVMAGDGVGGGRVLLPISDAAQPNLSFRWLALLWGARAALRSGAIPLARTHVQEALTTARQLDIEARALSQWVAADVLAQDGDPSRSLAWLSESRSRFEKIGDKWGAGQTRLSEARVLTTAMREREAAEAAEQAAAALPDSEEPTIVLARLAAIRDDLPAAEALVRPLRSQAAERIRVLVQSIRDGLLARSDAAEFLREQEAPPSARALRSLERISAAAPRFVQAREALAWMLLKLGRYDEANAVFRGLLAHALSPGDRASVMLGISCIANAQRAAGGGAATLREVVAVGSSPPPARSSDELPPLPPLSTSAILARSASSGAADSVFSGQLSSFALPDLLEFLRSGKRTGLLVCSSAAGMGALRFRDGWIAGAASPATPGVGDVLVRAGKADAAAIRASAAAVGGDPTDQLLGEQLVRDGVTDSGAVRWALSEQVRQAIRELMTWTDGEFTFNREAESPPEAGALAVALDPQGLLLNYFKDLDEAARGEAGRG
jgi:tetratricopeptide (TPR) repeat protein